MASQPTQSYLPIAAATVVAGLLISASIFLAIGEAAKTPTYVSTSTSTTVTTSTSTITVAPMSGSTSTGTVTSVSVINGSVVYSSIANGIQLSALIQPPIGAFGHNITVVAMVQDVLPISIQLNATGLDNPAYGPCRQDLATGINVYVGRYTSTNISEASPISLYNPSAIYTCPTESTLHYDLSPIKGIIETSVISGYWTPSGQTYTYNRYLPPGIYTVEVFDAWNQTAVGYIQVYYPVTTITS